ncbi:helitron helicase-like domain-containing protein [Artemisia annua]|uniref:Helitron helicase-like domain-containing protein n=1 Tax=Artemisia annua TaxID=35608 RepID=A0A2U1PFW0_ARTAN|nr:helitron helicase-like domain-containing protein [Artemisia annua]
MKGFKQVHASIQNIMGVAMEDKAYNQMFAMISLGVEIEQYIKVGCGSYVLKVSGHIYQWIGSMCPQPGEHPKFLQLDIYDIENKVANCLENFQRTCERLRADIVEDLIEFLDKHNELVHVFRTTRNKMAEVDIP